MYPTQDSSRMGTERMKQEEEADKNNSKIVRNPKERNVGTTRGEIPKQNPIRELLEGRESP